MSCTATGSYEAGGSARPREGGRDAGGYARDAPAGGGNGYGSRDPGYAARDAPPGYGPRDGGRDGAGFGPGGGYSAKGGGSYPPSGGYSEGAGRGGGYDDRYAPPKYGGRSDYPGGSGRSGMREEYCNSVSELGR